MELANILDFVFLDPTLARMRHWKRSFDPKKGNNNNNRLDVHTVISIMYRQHNTVGMINSE